MSHEQRRRIIPDMRWQRPADSPFHCRIIPQTHPTGTTPGKRGRNTDNRIKQHQQGRWRIMVLQSCQTQQVPSGRKTHETHTPHITTSTNLPGP